MNEMNYKKELIKLAGNKNLGQYLLCVAAFAQLDLFNMSDSELYNHAVAYNDARRLRTRK